MKHLATIAFALVLAGCTAAGVTVSTGPNLINDCKLADAQIVRAKDNVKLLTTAARAVVDPEVASIRKRCTGPLPADQTAASASVEASTANLKQLLDNLGAPAAK